MAQPVNFLLAKLLISAAVTPSILRLKTLDTAPAQGVDLQGSTQTGCADEEGSAETNVAGLAAGAVKTRGHCKGDTVRQLC